VRIKRDNHIHREREREMYMTYTTHTHTCIWQQLGVALTTRRTTQPEDLARNRHTRHVTRHARAHNNPCTRPRHCTAYHRLRRRRTNSSLLGRLGARQLWLAIDHRTAAPPPIYKLHGTVPTSPQPSPHRLLVIMCPLPARCRLPCV